MELGTGQGEDACCNNLVDWGVVFDGQQLAEMQCGLQLGLSRVGVQIGRCNIRTPPGSGGTNAHRWVDHKTRDSSPRDVLTPALGLCAHQKAARITNCTTAWIVPLLLGAFLWPALSRFPPTLEAKMPPICVASRTADVRVCLRALDHPNNYHLWYPEYLPPLVPLGPRHLRVFRIEGLDQLGQVPELLQDDLVLGAAVRRGRAGFLQGQGEEGLWGTRVEVQRARSCSRPRHAPLLTPGYLARYYP